MWDLQVVKQCGSGRTVAVASGLVKDSLWSTSLKDDLIGRICIDRYQIVSAFHLREKNKVDDHMNSIYFVGGINNNVGE